MSQHIAFGSRPHLFVHPNIIGGTLQQHQQCSQHTQHTLQAPLAIKFCHNAAGAQRNCQELGCIAACGVEARGKEGQRCVDQLLRYRTGQRTLQAPCSTIGDCSVLMICNRATRKIMQGADQQEFSHGSEWLRMQIGQ